MVAAFYFVADRVHQMSFPKSDTSVHEQRVVCLGRTFGYGKSCSVNELVRGTHDECVEGVFGIQRIVDGLEVQIPLNWRIRWGRGPLLRNVDNVDFTDSGDLCGLN